DYEQKEGVMMENQMKERILSFIQANSAGPLSVNELEAGLEVDSSVAFKEMVKALNALEDTGEIVRTRKNRFGMPEKMNLIRGKIQMHKKGFAFLIPDDSDQSDVYIHPTDLASA